LKEAIYKAAHPLLCQYVGFKEAEVTPHEDGTATCDWYLQSRADDRIGRLTAHWRILENEGYFLTSSSVEAKEN
jgi:4'-phosphopantetheinyl transferase EntD